MAIDLGLRATTGTRDTDVMIDVGLSAVFDTLGSLLATVSRPYFQQSFETLGSRRIRLLRPYDCLRCYDFMS